ncbi:hypothetical protein CHISP_0956 [Chitinispirillum alkaliphilum]|nr:hypothetical protein CHISP_0956 [Chitinispirillum alkaliphilum]
MSRGLPELLLFRDNNDKKFLLTKIGEVITQSDCECYGFALMGTHYHLILRPKTVSLSLIMQRINTSYATYYNYKYRRSGHVFGERFKSTVAQEYWYIRELIRYVNLNPVRGKICSDLDELVRYPWASHATVMGHSKHSWVSTHNILSRFGDDITAARECYLDWMSSGRGVKKNDWYAKKPAFMPVSEEEEKLFTDTRVKGSADFIRKALEYARKSKEILLKDITNRPELPDLLKSICLKKQIPPEMIMKRGRKCAVSQVRAEFCRKAIHLYGYTAVKTAEFLMINASSALRLSRKATV